MKIFTFGKENCHTGEKVNVFNLGQLFFKTPITFLLHFEGEEGG
jgi:hypothetical protein